MPQEIRKRVVITGIGPVTPAGIGKEIFWQNIIAGRSCCATIKSFDPVPFESRIGCEINDFVPGQYIPKMRERQTDRFTHLAIAAVSLALADAKIDLDVEDPARIGCVVGNSLGGVSFGERELYNLYTKGEDAVSPYQAIAWFYTASQGQITIQNGFTGYSKTYASDRLSSLHALGDAFRNIQVGNADIIFAGGSEAPFMPYGFLGYLKTNMISRRNDTPAQAYRPFDLHRDGMVLGEGGGFLVLEELEHALKRNASIYCELCGYATTSDGYHHVKMSSDGKMFAQAIKRALKEAAVDESQVGYINAAGEGTVLGDAVETVAIKESFPNHYRDIPVSAPKSMYGNLFGGAGAVDLIINCLVHETGTLPPTINHFTVDPLCDLLHVSNSALQRKCDAAVVNGIGIGGIYAALVTKKFYSTVTKRA